MLHTESIRVVTFGARWWRANRWRSGVRNCTSPSSAIPSSRSLTWDLATIIGCYCIVNWKCRCSLFCWALLIRRNRTLDDTRVDRFQGSVKYSPDSSLRHSYRAELPASSILYILTELYTSSTSRTSLQNFLYDLYEKNPSQKAKEGPQRSTKHWCIPKLEESRRQFSTARSPSPTFPWLGHLNSQPIFASFSLKWTVVTLSTIDVADYFSCLLHLLIIIIISFSCRSVKLF